ncbi:unnamed protein product [marine sediment metagenome]|uniref:Uncharacterized protein n=1 Tax=marine sediment metagenome TaxID=412755 RepID=X1H5W1_9ZZZZ
MSMEEPEKLHEKTPQWFKEWHDRSFWHFKYHVESRLSTHNRLLWGIVITVVAGCILNLILG